MRDIVKVPPAELEILKSAPAWQGRIKAAHTIVRELRSAEQFRFEPGNYRNLTAPVLLLLGGDSPEPFRSAIRELEAALPNSRLAVLPGQRHAAMDTGSEIFTEEVIRFLRPI